MSEIKSKFSICGIEITPEHALRIVRTCQRIDRVFAESRDADSLATLEYAAIYEVERGSLPGIGTFDYWLYRRAANGQVR